MSALSDELGRGPWVRALPERVTTLHYLRG